MKITFVKKHTYPICDGTVFEKETKTQQQFKDECDVNRQIARLTRHLDSTGMSISDYNNIGAMYGDFSEIPDFCTYNSIVAEAKEKFEALPTSIRERFNNSPEQLFDFVLDENNRDEAIKLGIVDIKNDISVSAPDIKTPAEAVSSDIDTPTV